MTTAELPHLLREMDHCFERQSFLNRECGDADPKLDRRLNAVLPTLEGIFKIEDSQYLDRRERATLIREEADAHGVIW